MSVSYPAIPIPLVTGYSHPDSRKVRFNNFNTGPPDFVLLSESGPSFPNVNWLFKEADFATFELFYKDDLKFGAISFNMNLQVGAGLKLHECYFNKPYKPSLQGKLWKVTASLVTVQKQYDTLEDFMAAADELTQISKGEFYFKMGELATNLRNSYSSSTFGQLDSDISLEIGDTIEFTYTANNNNPLTDENFIESSDGVNFFGWDSSTTIGEALMVGYTATVNGVAVNNGDQMPYNHPVNYPVGGARLEHKVILTATVATDIRFIGTALNAMPIYDVTITTSGQTWIYPIDSTGVTNADSNGSGNDLVLSSSTSIIDYPVMFNSGLDSNNIAPYLNVDSTAFNFSSNNFNYAAPSLRADGTGKSLDVNASTHYFGSIIEDIPIAYKDGFTVEIIVRFIASVSSDGLHCGVISSMSNSGAINLWVMGFDNLDGGSLVPTFTMIQRNNIYHNISTYSGHLADLRGTVSPVFENIYHLMGTIRISDNTMEFWINGLSQGSIQLTQTQMDDWMFGNDGEFGVQDVKNGLFGTRINIGTRFTNGAWRAGQDSHIQDFKIHLLEADDDFAALQASSANFTT